MPRLIAHEAHDRGEGPADGVPAEKPRVLVAEDHDDTRAMLRVVLERGGCDVLEARDGEEAVRLAESARPDLVLLDRSLPRLDGLAVLRRVRARGQAGRVPVIFLSGHAEPLARSAAFEAGCDDYLVKPIGLDRLTSVVARHLAHRKYQPQAFFMG